MNITRNELYLYLGIFCSISVITLGGFYFSNKDKEIEVQKQIETKVDTVYVNLVDTVVIEKRDTVEIMIPQTINESQTFKNLKETILQQDRIIRRLQNKK